jgi:hypothetical protein
VWDDQIIIGDEQNRERDVVSYAEFFYLGGKKSQISVRKVPLSSKPLDLNGNELER